MYIYCVGRHKGGGLRMRRGGRGGDKMREMEERETETTREGRGREQQKRGQERRMKCGDKVAGRGRRGGRRRVKKKGKME